MKKYMIPIALVAGLSVYNGQILTSSNNSEKYSVDQEMVDNIRQEGFDRSELSNTLSYMTDVLGARLTNSNDMRRAQTWATGEMDRIGLTNIVIEPFMDYGVSWDNEYFSLHLLEPDYQVMLGYPIAHTPGINGRRKMAVVIADIKTKSEMEKSATRKFTARVPRIESKPVKQVEETNIEAESDVSASIEEAVESRFTSGPQSFL